jgi:hypothetical protein
MSTLGVVILSLPGMKDLGPTLASVAWADAILVVHAGEGEPELAGKSPRSLVVRRVDFARGLTEPLDDIRTDWVLRLWGEERLEPGLQDELRELCRLDPAPAKSSYDIPLRTLLLGRWIEASLWEPSPAPRLGRGVGRLLGGWWTDRTSRETQPTGALRGRIADYGPVTLDEAMARINRVTGLWAEDMRRLGQAPGRADRVFFPLRVFLRLMFVNRLVGRGLAGLTLSTLAGYATLLAGAKWWEAVNVASAGNRS